MQQRRGRLKLDVVGETTRQNEAELRAPRYLGSKARVVAEIIRQLGSAPEHGRFVDVFCGTGVVGAAAARRGWRVYANDHLVAARVLAGALLASRKAISFRLTGGYESTVAYLNSLEPEEGFIFREYSPSGKSRSGHVRKYFTASNAKRIDAIRSGIRRLDSEGRLTPIEHDLLLADLLLAVSRVANIAGTYGCFLRTWAANSLNPLRLEARFLPTTLPSSETSSLDCFALATQPTDVVYLDPPYTKRQYAAYYHVLETIAHGDSPKVDGVTGLRPWEHLASPFCYKRRALEALTSLIRTLPARKYLVSYSSEGHIALSELEAALLTFGNLEVNPIGVIGRYRPNAVASQTGGTVTEYLLGLEVCR